MTAIAHSVVEPSRKSKSIAGAIVLSVMSIGPQATFLVFVMLAWTGGLINAVQTTMYALAAHVYPTSIRASPAAGRRAA